MHGQAGRSRLASATASPMWSPCPWVTRSRSQRSTVSAGRGLFGLPNQGSMRTVLPPGVTVISTQAWPYQVILVSRSSPIGAPPGVIVVVARRLSDRPATLGRWPPNGSPRTSRSSTGRSSPRSVSGPSRPWSWPVCGPRPPAATSPSPRSARRSSGCSPTLSDGALPTGVGGTAAVPIDPTWDVARSACLLAFTVIAFAYTVALVRGARAPWLGIAGTGGGDRRLRLRCVRLGRALSGVPAAPRPEPAPRGRDRGCLRRDDPGPLVPRHAEAAGGSAGAVRPGPPGGGRPPAGLLRRSRSRSAAARAGGHSRRSPGRGRCSSGSGCWSGSSSRWSSPGPRSRPPGPARWSRRRGFSTSTSGSSPRPRSWPPGSTSARGCWSDGGEAVSTQTGYVPSPTDRAYIEATAGPVHPTLAGHRGGCRARAASRSSTAKRDGCCRSWPAADAGSSRSARPSVTRPCAWLSAPPPDGTIVTLDPDRGRTDIARAFWREAGIADARIVVLNRPALEAFAAGEAEPALAGPFDLAFVDALKDEYPAYLEALVPRLAPGALVVADNVLWAGRVSGERPGSPGDGTDRPARLQRRRPASTPGSWRRSCPSATASSSRRSGADRRARPGPAVRGPARAGRHARGRPGSPGRGHDRGRLGGARRAIPGSGERAILDGLRPERRVCRPGRGPRGRRRARLHPAGERRGVRRAVATSWSFARGPSRPDWATSSPPDWRHRPTAPSSSSSDGPVSRRHPGPGPGGRGRPSRGAGRRVARVRGARGDGRAGPRRRSPTR